jgi:hypothetical protein
MSADTNAIASSYRAGMSLRSIGSEYHLSHETVRKIVRSLGLDRLQGGRAIKSLKTIRGRVDKKLAQDERREARSRKIWDLSMGDLLAHISEYGGSQDIGSPMWAFKIQRSNAQKRGVEWKFTFREWWQVWLDSGKWQSRGRHREDFVMARYGDGDAPYSPSTVYICTASSNVKDGFLYKPHEARKRS